MGHLGCFCGCNSPSSRIYKTVHVTSSQGHKNNGIAFKVHNKEEKVSGREGGYAMRVCKEKEREGSHSSCHGCYNCLEGLQLGLSLQPICLAAHNTY
eukprot:988414-Pelagomonas_calceolata.AAC.1